MVAFTPLILLLSALAASVSAAPIPTSRAASKSGQGTFFEPGLGACGIHNSSKDMIVAVSQQLFDSFPGAGKNPNKNPICNKSITAHFKNKSVKVKVTDRCTGCKLNDLDFTPSAFSKLADQSLGRIPITWEFN